MSRMLYIDYENVQRVDLKGLDQRDLKVWLFTGVAQSKIPIDLAKSIQSLGDKLHWITIDGNGPNALDFHIAYYLGVHAAQNTRDEHFLLSKDKGFDPLISHVGKNNIRCKRIASPHFSYPSRVLTGLWPQATWQWYVGLLHGL